MPPLKRLSLLYLIAPVLPGITCILRKYKEYTWGWVTEDFSLTGKTYIITGSNYGIGLETIKDLARRDATVIMACRDMRKAKRALNHIKACTSSGKVLAMEIDLGDFHSIRRFAMKIRQKYPKFNCLINNYNVGLNTSIITKQNYEIHWGVNYLGHFLLTFLLLDLIRENNAKIVIVTNENFKHGFINVSNLIETVKTRKVEEDEIETSNQIPWTTRYSNSCLANFYLGMAMEKMGFETYVVVPGLTLPDVLKSRKRTLYNFVLLSPWLLFECRSMRQASQTLVKCATQELKPASDRMLNNISDGYVCKDCEFTRMVPEQPIDQVMCYNLWQLSKKLCYVDKLITDE